MKYDPQLEQQILQLIEDDPKASGRSPFRVLVAGKTEDEVHYHLRLMMDRGLIICDRNMAVVRMTWNGHMALEDMKMYPSEVPTPEKAVPTELKKTKGRPRKS